MSAAPILGKNQINGPIVQSLRTLPMKSRTYSTGVNWTGLLPAFITALPQNPIKALRGILKGKPSMAQALVEERKQEVECKVAIS